MGIRLPVESAGSAGPAEPECDGHGVGYDYPHDNPQGWVEQQYLPDAQRDKKYYEPSEHGAEADVARRMDERK